MPALSWLWRTKTYQVSDLIVYPVKSFKGISLDASQYTETGLAYDRHWMVVEADTLTMCTARTVSHMMLIETDLDYDNGSLRIRIPAKDGIPASEHSLPLEATADAELIRCKVHASLTDGYIVADEEHPLSRALSLFMSKRVMVLRKGEHVRESNPDFWSLVDVQTAYENPSNTAFADDWPILLGCVASLQHLREQIAQSKDAKVLSTVRGLSDGPLAMRRFRPNIVVDGDLEPWEEDGWRTVTIAEESFHIVARCTRCPMPNVDPVTGIRSVSVPSATLSTYRMVDPFRPGLTCFGVNAVPIAPQGTLRVGDEVRVLSRWPRNSIGGFLRPEDTPSSENDT